MSGIEKSKRQHHNKGKVWGKPFKKGCSGNPIGFNGWTPEKRRLHRKHKERIKKITRFTNTQLIDITYKYLGKNKYELIKIYEKGEANAMEMIVIGAILYAIKKGDLARLDWIMDKLFDEKSQQFDIATKEKYPSNLSSENIQKINALMLDHTESQRHPLSIS